MSTVFSLICLDPSFQKMAHHFLLHGSLRPTNLEKNQKPCKEICLMQTKWNSKVYHSNRNVKINHTFTGRDFPRPDLRPNIGPFTIKKWAKTSQNGVYYSQFLSSTFWWKFHDNLNKNSKVRRCMKICIKMWMKTCFHSQNMNESMFSFTFLSKFLWVFMNGN